MATAKNAKGEGCKLVYRGQIKINYQQAIGL